MGVVATAAALIVALALEVVPSEGQDALICRKRDEQGGPGARVYHLGPGDDYFNGGPGPDVVYGGAGDDIINGGRGDDLVHGGPGDDIACGGVGRDDVRGDEGKDSVYGEEGNDTVVGGPGDDYLAGQAGRDRLIGFGRSKGKLVPDGADLMEGSYLPDILLLGGPDSAFGGFENDTLRSKTPKAGADLMDGGPGNDTVVGNSGEDVIADVLGDNVLRGKGGDDDITGGSQIDRIDGGGGDDHLQGERGRDFIYGADGVDTCFGGYDAHLDPTCESRHFNGEVTPPAGEEAARFTGAPPLAATSGSCTAPGTEFATGPIPQTLQSEVLVRYSTSILYSTVSDRGQGGLYLNRTGPGTTWATTRTPFFPEAGFSGTIGCTDIRNDPAGWSLQFFLPPLAPVTFPGSTMPGDGGAMLLFKVPETGEYEARAALSQGSLSIKAGFGGAETITGEGTYPLGTLERYVLQRLFVDAVGTEQARWTIEIRKTG